MLKITLEYSNENRKSPRIGQGESFKMGKQRKKKDCEKEKWLFWFLKLLRMLFWFLKLLRMPKEEGNDPSLFLL